MEQNWALAEQLDSGKKRWSSRTERWIQKGKNWRLFLNPALPGQLKKELALESKMLQEQKHIQPI